MDEKLKLSPPWTMFYKEIKALFEEDEDITITYDEDNVELKLFVDGSKKADALAQLLPEEKTFGSVTLKISVIPADEDTSDIMTLFERAFEGNPAVSYTQRCDPTDIFKMSYVVFEKKVVQFFNDDISDVNGYCSTLYKEIADRIFEGKHDGVYFCTDIEDPLKHYLTYYTATNNED